MAKGAAAVNGQQEILGGESGVARIAAEAAAARDSGPRPYTRCDWEDSQLDLKRRVEEVAARASVEGGPTVRPGAVLVWLAARHLEKLEADPSVLVDDYWAAREDALARELEAIRAKRKKG